MGEAECMMLIILSNTLKDVVEYVVGNTDVQCFHVYVG